MPDDGRPNPEISIDRRIGLEDAWQVVCGRARLGLQPAARGRCRSAHARLQKVVSENRHVYGVTTGFGPLANRLVGAAQIGELQQNLVHHLASGVGPYLGWEEARAVVLARLMAILQGASGASDSAIDALLGVLNSHLAPALPSRGTVGASGDLTPLAHLVLCLQGRGEFLSRDGSTVSGPEALARVGVPPLDLRARDALALVNGTSAMTGLALVAQIRADRAIAWALALSAACAEVLCGRVEAWDARLAELRPHPGQLRAVATLGGLVADGDLFRRGYLADRRLDAGLTHQTEEVAGQDAYTIRCVPQVVGAVLDTADWHARVLETELHSVTDNPVFPDSADAALHGGNFMGQHIALTSDALANALAVLAGLAERQIARLTDERLNGGLPPFLHRGAAGLNSGLMGAQVTATALLAELRGTGPAAVHSISTNGANQDVVSMGTVAARFALDKLALLSRIQAILAIAVAQAADLRCAAASRGVVDPVGASGGAGAGPNGKRPDGGPHGQRLDGKVVDGDAKLGGTGAFSGAADRAEEDTWPALSENLGALRAHVRSRSAAIIEDRPLGEDIEALAEAMERSGPPQAA